MGRHTRHGMDDQPLEGGGRGGGYGSAMGKVAEGAAIVGGGAGLMAGPIINAMQSGEKIQKKEREAAAEIKRESRGSQDSMTPGQKQSMQEAKDAAMQSKKDKAYNAAKTYPDDYAKGGMTASSRADGIAQRGKTRGKMI